MPVAVQHWFLALTVFVVVAAFCRPVFVAAFQSPAEPIIEVASDIREATAASK